MKISFLFLILFSTSAFSGWFSSEMDCDTDENIKRIQKDLNSQLDVFKNMNRLFSGKNAKPPLPALKVTDSDQIKKNSKGMRTCKVALSADYGNGFIKSYSINYYIKNSSDPNETHYVEQDNESGGVLGDQLVNDAAEIHKQKLETQRKQAEADKKSATAKRQKRFKNDAIRYGKLLINSNNGKIYDANVKNFLKTTKQAYKEAFIASPTGKTTYKYNCSICHGVDAKGTTIAPDLTDSAWQYGGSVNAIKTSITNGRKGVMPAHSKTMSKQEIDSIAHAIFNKTPASSPLFMSKACFACHGPGGKGMTALGSADLTDQFYRFNDKEPLASIKHTISHGVNHASDPETRIAIMPYFGRTLGKHQITQVAEYVYTLSGQKVVSNKTKKYSPKTGKDVYYSRCVACHQTGALKAPVVGNKDDWSPRISKGMDKLLNNLITGFGAEVPRGTCKECSDEQLRIAIKYMVKQSQ